MQQLLNKQPDIQSVKDGFDPAIIKALPVMEQLADRGRELEAQGLIQVEYGSSYAVAAMDHLLQKA
ncbi:hypothetical protein [Comamonas terrigena]|uniref:hypothetical protein n=1 Tax=Comamonas terrigena TaxID=32013 RepID=UPI002448B6A5|nr:hypothetical protein [Comamonas terrigena]MDH0051018.1 hypothetical protein [Comamonas terrigena]MDH0513493.1 hypothetical protein [Comamonas terrigena]MDH1092963.1 hypothetical protein [Comamonas terrigena]MDH1501367.1 hypothetical protein [Comamonas terrigena]